MDWRRLPCIFIRGENNFEPPVLVPDFGIDRPGAGSRAENIFTANENSIGRLILVWVVSLSVTQAVAIHEKIRNRFWARAPLWHTLRKSEYTRDNANTHSGILTVLVPDFGNG